MITGWNIEKAAGKYQWLFDQFINLFKQTLKSLVVYQVVNPEKSEMIVFIFEFSFIVIVFYVHLFELTLVYYFCFHELSNVQISDFLELSKKFIFLHIQVYNWNLLILLFVIPSCEISQFIKRKISMFQNLAYLGF